MRLLQLYKERTAHRPDTEHTQALLRVLILTSACIYIVYLKFNSDAGPGVTAVVFLSYLFSILLFAHILRYPDINVTRRILGLIHDPLIATVVFYLVNEKMAMYLFIFTWVAIGNGFRFGAPYLYASGALGTLGIAALLRFASDWQTNWYFGAGVLITNIAVTGYTGAILNQLKLAQAKLEQKATHDPLTGLANRRLLFDRLRHAMVLNHRHMRPLALLYFDLDDFKLINDNYGHQVGDDLLRTVASKIRECIRESDTFARWGGDEFVIVFDSLQSQEDALLGSHRIMHAIESLTKVGGHQVKVSASIGLAKLNHGGTTRLITPEDFIRAADEAMYKAKKNGKARIESVEIGSLPSTN